MIFISLDPFLLKRILLVLLTLIGLSCASSYAEHLLVTVNATPYDHQMSRIQPILSSDGRGRGQEHVSLRMVNNWIGNLRSIPYGFSRVWRTPSETQSGSPADCKAKAVALYQTMKDHGATDLRLVIGKRTSRSRATHAWVEWQADGDSYVLDPTINWMAYRSGDVGSSSYIPFYEFAGNRKYRCATATLVAQN